jgi:hypothetical protein
VATVSGTAGAAGSNTAPAASASASASAPASADADTPVPEPKAKKSRTNTPWTPAEEQRLKQMRDAGHSWSEIAKVGTVHRAAHMSTSTW